MLRARQEKLWRKEVMLRKAKIKELEKLVKLVNAQFSFGKLAKISDSGHIRCFTYVKDADSIIEPIFHFSATHLRLNSVWYEAFWKAKERLFIKGRNINLTCNPNGVGKLTAVLNIAWEDRTDVYTLIDSSLFKLIVKRYLLELVS
jgi:hypothetical protein